MSGPILNHDRITAPDAAPERWLLFLHGIYGAGRNWSSIARRLVRERSGWGAVLVDLREHGGSQGFEPPHTIAAAAEDLSRLVREIGVESGGVLGHSFGGKVALAYARDHADAREQVWVVDSTPEPREPEGSAWEMLAVLRRLPAAFETRTEGVEALVGQGIARPIAQWMSTNLEPADGEYRWRIDFDTMEALLRDFFATDLWSVVEDPPEGSTVHLIKAEASSVLSGEAEKRAERAARESERVHLHRVEGGHWLNADNPDALVELLAASL